MPWTENVLTHLVIGRSVRDVNSLKVLLEVHVDDTSESI